MEEGREGITQRNECMKIILKHFEKKYILITIQMVFTRRFSGGFKITWLDLFDCEVKLYY